MANRQRGSVLAGMAIMLLLSVLLFWLPGLGTLIAGIIGGKIAGSVGGGLMAALLPSLLAGVAVFALAQWFTGVPLFAMLAGFGVSLLALTQIGMLLLGAIIGGLLA